MPAYRDDKATDTDWFSHREIQCLGIGLDRLALYFIRPATEQYQIKLDGHGSDKIQNSLTTQRNTRYKLPPRVHRPL
jgi:hypothetical protein